MSLLAGFNWFFNPAWAVQKLFTLWGDGGGGSSGPTNTTVQNTNLPDYVQPYVMSMLGAAQNQMFNTNAAGDITGFKPYTPYSTDPTKYFAGFSPLQQQAQQGAANLVTPGQFGAGSRLAGAAGMGSLGTAGQMAGAGANYNAMATNPYAVGAFMNPYIQNSLQPQLNQIAQQGNIASNQAASQATGSGAFGGTRGALAQNLAQQNALMAQQNAIGQGYNTAYQNAQQAQQFGANLGLQGLQGALTGYGQAGQAGAELGQLGQQQLSAQQGIIGTQAAQGQAEQTLQQNIINQAVQNYAQQQQQPIQNLSNLSALLHGLPMQNTTTQSYQAAPSTVSQLGGLAATGIGAYGALSKAEGGVIGMKSGGLVDLALKNTMEGAA